MRLSPFSLSLSLFCLRHGLNSSFCSCDQATKTTRGANTVENDGLEWACLNYESRTSDNSGLKHSFAALPNSSWMGCLPAAAQSARPAPSATPAEESTEGGPSSLLFAPQAAPVVMVLDVILRPQFGN